MPKVKPVLLVVLDGWGLRAEREANAIAIAGTPSMDALVRVPMIGPTLAGRLKRMVAGAAGAAAAADAAAAPVEEPAPTSRAFRS